MGVQWLISFNRDGDIGNIDNLEVDAAGLSGATVAVEEVQYGTSDDMQTVTPSGG